MGSTEDQPELPRSPAVVAALVENHREFLAFLQRRVHDRATAEDILQEAFARGLDRLETLQNDESVRAWFYRTLRNAVVDHYRRRGLLREVPATDPPETIYQNILKALGR